MNFFVKWWNFGMDERQKQVQNRAFASAFFSMMLLLILGLVIRPDGHSLFATQFGLVMTAVNIPWIIVQVRLITADAFFGRWQSGGTFPLAVLSLINAYMTYRNLMLDIDLNGMKVIWQHHQLQNGWTQVMQIVFTLTLGITLTIKGFRAKRDEERKRQQD